MLDDHLETFLAQAAAAERPIPGYVEREPRAYLACGIAALAAENTQAEGKTTVIEVIVTQELGDPFRRAALSKPVRFLDKYKAYT